MIIEALKFFKVKKDIDFQFKSQKRYMYKAFEKTAVF